MKKKTVIRDKGCAPAAIDLRAELPGALEKLKGFALILTKDRHEAEDLLQQTAYRALACEHQFDTTTTLGAWLYVILRNEFLDRCRKVKRRRTDALASVNEDALARPETQTGTIYLKEVNAIIGKLHGGQAAALSGIGLGLSYEETGELLGVSVGTVKSRLWRARAALERMVA